MNEHTGLHVGSGQSNGSSDRGPFLALLRDGLSAMEQNSGDLHLQKGLDHICLSRKGRDATIFLIFLTAFCQSVTVCNYSHCSFCTNWISSAPASHLMMGKLIDDG